MINQKELNANIKLHKIEYSKQRIKQLKHYFWILCPKHMSAIKDKNKTKKGQFLTFLGWFSKNQSHKGFMSK